MTDDLDPSLSAQETLTFGVDGSRYEIDLATANADALRSALQPYVDAARRTGGRATLQRSSGTKSASGPSDAIDTAAVKAWADSNGVTYNKRGRLSAAIIQEFRDAIE